MNNFKSYESVKITLLYLDNDDVCTASNGDDNIVDTPNGWGGGTF